MKISSSKSSHQCDTHIAMGVVFPHILEYGRNAGRRSGGRFGRSKAWELLVRRRKRSVGPGRANPEYMLCITMKDWPLQTGCWPKAVRRPRCAPEGRAGG